MDEENSGGGGLMSGLKNMPTWEKLALIAVAGLAVYLLWFNNSSSTAASTAASTTPASQTPAPPYSQNGAPNPGVPAPNGVPTPTVPSSSNEVSGAPITNINITLPSSTNVPTGTTGTSSTSNTSNTSNTDNITPAVTVASVSNFSPSALGLTQVNTSSGSPVYSAPSAAVKSQITSSAVTQSNGLVYDATPGGTTYASKNYKAAVNTSGGLYQNHKFVIGGYSSTSPSSGASFIPAAKSTVATSQSAKTPVYTESSAIAKQAIVSTKTVQPNSYVYGAGPTGSTAISTNYKAVVNKNQGLYQNNQFVSGSYGTGNTFVTQGSQNYNAAHKQAPSSYTAPVSTYVPPVTTSTYHAPTVYTNTQTVTPTSTTAYHYVAPVTSIPVHHYTPPATKKVAVAPSYKQVGRFGIKA